MNDEEFEKFKRRFAERLSKELKGEEDENSFRTEDFEKFRKQFLPKHLSFYEKACSISEKLLKLSPDKKTIPELEEAIKTCHLNTTPTGVTSFSILLPLIIIFISLIIGFFLPFILTNGESFNFFLVITGLILAVSLIIPLQKIPFYFANNWRMKASNQMVLAVFYMVTFMRHTSNLERAINFAAEHLDPPLSLDLKRVLWNVETENFSSVKESLDDYLLTWRKWNMEFIESMHLIEGSLYESSESRRLDALDKALSVILEETYEKMLHYAHDLKGPITTLHMLGIILPILGLVILPLVVSFMPEVKWYHLFVLYNVFLPLIVYYLAKTILSKRPTGYGQADISETIPSLKKYKNIIINLGGAEIRINPIIFSLIIFGILFIIGISPVLLWHAGGDCADWTYTVNGEVLRRCEVEEITDIKYSLLDYREIKIKQPGGEEKTEIRGPYGLGASLISLAIPLAIALSIGFYFRHRSKNIIKIRERAKKLETEFAAALFQLGNRLADGLPPEMAFQKVAETMRDTTAGKFFELVSINVEKMGMGVEQAIFDPEHGALVSFPSNLIESSMKVLVESSKKGPLIASQALINVSEYIKEMHRVDERLKDLMAEVISSMKSQIAFLTPAIAGVVVGITSMITQIIGSLGDRLSSLSNSEAATGVGSQVQLLSLLNAGVPTYYFQIIVGIYVVQIVYLLTILVNGIQNGADDLNEKYLLGKNIIKSTITYSMVTFTIMLLFSLIATGITSSVGG